MKVPFSLCSISSLGLAALAATALLMEAPVLAQDGAGKPAKSQAQDLDPWKNEKKTLRGSVALERIYKAAGGKEEWEKLDGIRFDMLETWRVIINLETKESRIHHRTPRLCWFTPEGDGYILSENVGGDGITASYRREVSVGAYSWAEASGATFRQPGVVSKANNHMDRTFFLSCMPHSLDHFGAEMVFLKELRGGQSLYGIRLARPLILHDEEPVSEFLAIVDKEANKIVRLDYSLSGRDRMTPDTTRCRVNFEGEKALGGVTIANKYLWSFQTEGNTREYWVEDVVNASVPPEALRRPWQTGSMYTSDVRADFFDPPAEEEKVETPKEAEDGK